MPKKVLVTGADGFIGSHLVQHLLQSGHQVRAFTLYNSFSSHGWLDSLPKAEFDQVEIIPGDIRDPGRVRQAMEDIDWVFHLAALIAIPFSYSSPESYLQVNAQGTLNVLQAARQCQTERVLITSSSEVYGTAREVPITESHPLQAQSPYSASKIAAEAFARAFWHSYQLPVTIVRPFNTYGPRQSARAIIPAIITQLLHQPETLQLGNLHPTRDLCYVQDTARAFEAIAESTRTIGTTLNVATGKETSVGELAQLLIQRLSPETTILHDPARSRPQSSEVDRLLGSAALLQDLTDWKPQVSLAEGLEQCIPWYRDSKHQSQFAPDRYHV